MDEAWKEFVLSGRVTDYLRFKGVGSDGCSYEVSYGRERKRAVEEQEVMLDGTEYRCDRNGFTGNASWRV